MDDNKKILPDVSITKVKYGESFRYKIYFSDSVYGRIGKPKRIDLSYLDGRLYIFPENEIRGWMIVNINGRPNAAVGKMYGIEKTIGDYKLQFDQNANFFISNDEKWPVPIDEKTEKVKTVTHKSNVIELVKSDEEFRNSIYSIIYPAVYHAMKDALEGKEAST